jgi:hypothetical protein
MPVQLTSPLLELPDTWLALLVQHLASGLGGLARAASLNSTCKALHSLSEGPAVIYRNISMETPISSPDHPLWQWLAKRSGRIDGLSLDLHLEVFDHATSAEQLIGWMQPLQTLSGIPGTQLGVELDDLVDEVDHPCITQWLREHGQIISHLTVHVDISEGKLTLGEFSEAAAACPSVDLTIWHSSSQVVDLADLDAVAVCLHSLTCEAKQDWWEGTLRGASVFNSMTQLTALSFHCEHFEDDESWALLAKLTGLQQLSLMGCTSGDPSPVSAMTRLTSLTIHTHAASPQGNDLAPFTFSSLQPLSALQQLEVLFLGGRACTATSLQGLAGFSNLKVLKFEFADGGGMLRSLEGISPGLTELSIRRLQRHCLSLAGIEGCTSMEKLSLCSCGVSSLWPIRSFSSLKELDVYDGRLTSLEGLDRMPLQSLSLASCDRLIELSGVEHLSSLKSLKVMDCDGISSLQPLSQLGEGLEELRVVACKGVQEEVLELPHVQPTADVDVRKSNVKEVVLAGGVRRAVLPR